MKAARAGMAEIPLRIPAEIWDQMQFFFKEYNDHQVHAVIYFDELLDWPCLRKALLLSVKSVPILGCRFVANRFRPYWEKFDRWQDSEFISLIECLNPEAEIDRFLTSVTHELTGPQMMAGLIRSHGRDTLCIVINHMVCDGAGFKEYLYLLSSNYTKLQNGQPMVVHYNRNRNVSQIYQAFKLQDRMNVFFLPNTPLKNRNTYAFPFTPGVEGRRPFILKQKLAQEEFLALKAYAKKHSATINDIVVTAFYRVLDQVLEIKKGEPLTIPCMVDLRRYLPDKASGTICNLTSMITCNIGSDIGRDFTDTLEKVSHEMKAQKQGYPGMHGLSTLNMLFKLLPFGMLQEIIKNKFVNPFIAMSNIGIINSQRLVFGKTPVADAFMTGSIKYPPYFQLALSSFKETMTFTVAIHGSKREREVVRKFLLQLDKELRSIC